VRQRWRLAEGSVGGGLLDVARFENPSVDVIGLTAVQVKDSMMGMNALPAVLTVAAKQLKAARFLVRLLHQAHREILWELIALPHEHPE
jgi:hypothetical protein